MSKPPPFLALSQIVTGIEELPGHLSDGYRSRLTARCGVETVEAVVALIGQIPHDELLARIDADPAHRSVAEQLAMLWYASATFAESGDLTFGSPEEYFGSQLWPVIRAHPPGLSGGYMGHWRYPPE